MLKTCGAELQRGEKNKEAIAKENGEFEVEEVDGGHSPVRITHQ